LTPCENNGAVHILPHNSRTVTDSEERSIKANRKSAMGFPVSHQPRSCASPNFPNRNNACFRFYMRSAVQSALQTLFVLLIWHDLH